MGSLIRNGFFYTTKKTYESKGGVKTNEMEFCRSDCFSVDSLTYESIFVMVCQLTPSRKQN